MRETVDKGPEMLEDINMTPSAPPFSKIRGRGVTVSFDEKQHVYGKANAFLVGKTSIIGKS